MLTRYPKAIVAAFLLIINTYTLNATIPQHIAYQGVLTDTAGNPRPNGAYSFTFSLYDAETGGTALWSETKSLYLKNGMFSTFLGNTTPFGNTVTFDKPYWLGISVNGAVEFSPRITLSSSAYSFKAIRADTAEYAKTATSGIADSSGIAANAYLLAGQPGSFYRNAANIDTGTLDDARLSENVSKLGAAIESAEIADATIQRGDVAGNFKAPYADTADFARNGSGTGMITDTNIVEDAAIAGTKINPSFGNQNITTLGAVGVGTTAPLAKFHVSSGPTEYGGVLFSGENHNTGDSATRVGIKDITGGTEWWLSQNNNGDFAIHQSWVGDLFTIKKNSGNIGIGTSGPKSKLEVAGEIHSTTGGFKLPDGTVIDDSSDIGNGDSYWAKNGANVYYDSGNVGVGVSNPANKLEVSGTAKATSLYLYDETTDPFTFFRIEKTRQPCTYYFRVNAHNLEIIKDSQINFALASDGSLGLGWQFPSYKLHVNGDANANNWYTNSDARLKKNITAISDALYKVNKLQGVEFEWSNRNSSSFSLGKGRNIGFIAQDVEKVLPELVHTDDNGYKSLSYDKLTAVLVEAIKEQQTQIEEYKQKLEKQQEQIDKLISFVGMND